MVGADENFKESLFCQDGSIIEPYKSFSIIPYLYCDRKLTTREDVTLRQSLEKGHLPLPSVAWEHPKLAMNIMALACGDPGQTVTYARYRVKNISPGRVQGKLFLAMPPFEINPPWQWGGSTKIQAVQYDGGRIRINEYEIVPFVAPTAFGVSTTREGGIIHAIERGVIPERTDIRAPNVLASAALEYSYDLGPSDEKDFFIAVPLHNNAPVVGADGTRDEPKRILEKLFNDCIRFWESQLGKPGFTIPDDDIAKTLKANLAYILVNRDGPAVQSGSRGYEAAWIRGGAMTCAALLRMGYADEVREYLDWYPKYLYEDGRVPAIVIIGRNEINPVKEYDS